MYAKQLALEKALGLTPKRSFDDIAKECGITRQAARMAYYRALKKYALALHQTDPEKWQEAYHLLHSKQDKEK